MKGWANRHRCRGIEFQVHEGTGMADKPEITAEDTAPRERILVSSFAHPELLSSNKMT